MRPPEPLLEVAASWPLPGLGVLLLPASETPAGPLAAYELHTVLRVQLVLPTGEREEALASVEEVAHSGIVRALLLTHESAVAVPPGTQVYALPAVSF